jgi:large subunit ribosomal protein L32e
MSQITRLLEIRKEMRKRKPKFLAQDVHKKKKIRKRWVRPRGLHSKIRLEKKGYNKRVKPGYRTPLLVRGMVKGINPVVVCSLRDLDTLKPEDGGVIISSTLGQRKKLDLVKACKEKKLYILNLDIKKFETSVQENMKVRKDKKSKLGKKKAVKEKVKISPKSKESVSQDNKISKEQKDSIPEDKEKKEKKAQDKILTQKQQ